MMTTESWRMRSRPSTSGCWTNFSQPLHSSLSSFVGHFLRFRILELDFYIEKEQNIQRLKWCIFLFLMILMILDDEECVECDAILEELETVDDEADAFGIDFVKNNDPHAARQYNIYNTPALVYFRRMSPVV